jgi:translation initiation factor 2B subunit (eIF-2B alpha/beta/delta family)
MGFFIDKVDLIIFGVDSILKNGAIINKIGTHPLSITGKKNGVMVYAITDSYKYNLRSHLNKDIEIERKKPDEIYDNSVLDLEILNYYFDITPPEYLTGIISDLGVLDIPNFLNKIQKELPLDWIKEFKDIL